MRSGPGKEYAILWVYQKQGLPVEIINEFEHWRRIRDLDGSEGWIHQSIISGKRTIITLEGTHNIYKEPNITSDKMAIIDGGIIATPEKCIKNFCFITHSEFSGWIEKNIIYGIYDHENFD
jgi:SH3-like domain-containing protein